MSAGGDGPKDPRRAGVTELVVLLDETGAAMGTAPKATVHTAHTPLHRAFSLHLRRPDGRVLLTRRALSKRTWPGVWTNAVCGHPGPGEPFAEAIRRRLDQELRITPAQVGPLEEVAPRFRYRAVDASGVVENEMCPVFVADLLSDPDDLPEADPAEVMETAWARWEDVASAASALPFLLSPWLMEHSAEPAIDAALRSDTAPSA